MSKGSTITRALAATVAVAGLGVAVDAAPALAHAAPHRAHAVPRVREKSFAASPGLRRNADVLAESSCASQGTDATVFSPWGDDNEYWLVAGSTFAGSAPGWTLTGGATPVAGGDPYDLTGTPSASSLSLPAGATATSPYVCVDSSQPTFRFLDAASAAGAELSVSVVYQTTAGPVSAVVGTIDPDGWEPTPILQNGAQIAGAIGGGTARMAVRITAVSGTSQVDDLYVDPRMGWGN